MTACAIDTAEGNGNPWTARAGCVITADGSYAARLALDGDSWFPERWTLDGPEPYAVPLPGNQPEEPGTEVLPMADGRVLIHRLADGRHAFSLLYPTGPGTGEVPLGAVECPDSGTELRLLPPAPGGSHAYALAVGRGSTAVWLVAGGAFGPEHLAEVPGRCSGGAWLGGEDRLLALDRELDGRTKTVVVDLERGGEVSPLLQIAEESNDRLLLADADSGLLLIRSDAPSPGQERLGWGVLGSTLPVRFPESLHLPGCLLTPFAVQPGQVLTPESCAVALRIDGASGSWLGVWRPTDRQIHQLRVPAGWLAGSGMWTRDGVLHLPYATHAVPCGVARVAAPTGAGDVDPGDPDGTTAEASGEAPRGPSVTDPPESATPRPVPLQQAPLVGRVVANAFAGRRLARGDGGGAGRVVGNGGGGWVAEVGVGVGGGRVAGDGAGRPAAGDAGRAAADGSGRVAADGTGRPAADGPGQVTAGGAGWVAAGGAGRVSAEGAGRVGSEGPGLASGGGAGHAAAGSTGHVVPGPGSASRTVAEDTGRATAESIRPADPVPARAIAPHPHLGPGPHPHPGPDSDPGPGPEVTQPLRIERISAEAPPALRSLSVRSAAETAAGPRVDPRVPAAPRAVPETAETTPLPSP